MGVTRERKDGGSGLVPPDQIAGTFIGNGCLCSPPFLRMEIMPGASSASTATRRLLAMWHPHAPRALISSTRGCSVLRWHLRAQVLRELPDPFHVPVHDELLWQLLHGL